MKLQQSSACRHGSQTEPSKIRASEECSWSIPLWTNRVAGKGSAFIAFVVILPAQKDSQLPLMMLLNCIQEIHSSSVLVAGPALWIGEDLLIEVLSFLAVYPGQRLKMIGSQLFLLCYFDKNQSAWVCIRLASLLGNSDIQYNQKALQNVQKS